MLLIPTYLAESTIPGAGIGLFCAEFVAAGTVVWRFHDGFDFIVDTLPDNAVMRAFVLKNGWLRRNGKKGWVLSADDNRFFNHSETPNCVDIDEVTTVARVDLAAGTEMTLDYRTFSLEDYFDNAAFDPPQPRAK